MASKTDHTKGVERGQDYVGKGMPKGVTNSFVEMSAKDSESRPWRSHRRVVRVAHYSGDKTEYTNHG